MNGDAFLESAQVNGGFLIGLRTCDRPVIRQRYDAEEQDEEKQDVTENQFHEAKFP